MFGMFDRETMVMIALVVSLAATFYLYNEIQKQKQDMTNVKTYVSKKLSHAPANDAKPVVTEEVVEEEEEEEEE